jgi:GGDEF domain-containing protein
MNDESLRQPQPDRIQRLYLTLLVFAASLLASALVVIYNNSIRTLSVFIFFLFLGVGIMLALGLARGVLAGMLMISTWIAAKQLLGVWEEVRLLNNLLEIILAGLTFIFSGIYHDRLQAILNIYKENQSRLKQLDIEDKMVGLIKPSVGLLRLNEEEERSVRYRRPFALIVVMVQPKSRIMWDYKDEAEIMRAIAANIKDTTRDTDIPFRADNHKIAVILPETETNGANKVVNNIFNRMLTTRFVTSTGDTILIQTTAQLRFGFAAFMGESRGRINVMEAAERSLQQSVEMNSDDLFQNLFIEWETVGEQPLAVPLLGKAIS